ncbi:hypothetical protein PVK06_042488 [Gossypium arboreum]|uniref:Uncharacterized protein n=1 Tax=Gossypium arboreum TaxID=29729 RepID=A0ABR0MMX7_GOSAR|nr:hypothetical protein PVK06_042488 [Gossypium arboreum]
MAKTITNGVYLTWPQAIEIQAFSLELAYVSLFSIANKNWIPNSQRKHQAPLHKVVLNAIAYLAEVVPASVGTREGISSQILTFEQRIQQYLGTEIASQENSIQQLQVNVRHTKALRNELLAKLLQ